MTITLQQSDPRSAGATALLRASHALMEASFPSEHNHYLSIDALCTPNITFFTATKDGETLGCGALANKGAYGEVKSMFTAETARGKGLADKILAAIIQSAADQSLPTLRLETGNSLHAAHRLYERHGFFYTDPFGDYTDSPVSIFMEKPRAQPNTLKTAIENPLSPDAETLIAASETALRVHYTIADCASFAAADLAKPEITFLVARQNQTAIGCVALANCATYGEVKRLIVTPDARGTGAAKMLMHHLESIAKQQNLTTIRLETRAKLTAAAALYTRLGYTPTGPFGSYPAIPDSRFYEKRF
jgi:putative acetyltransferase